MKGERVIFKRKVFGDPVLIVYLLDGKPIFANSFLVKEMWWDGLLEDEDLNTSVDNLYSYAYKKYGDKYLNHIRNYAKYVINESLRKIKTYGWQIDVEKEKMKREKILDMFAIAGGDIRERIIRGLEGKGFFAITVEDYGLRDFIGSTNLTPGMVDKLHRVFQTDGEIVVFPTFLVIGVKIHGYKILAAGRNVNAAISTVNVVDYIDMKKFLNFDLPFSFMGVRLQDDVYVMLKRDGKIEINNGKNFSQNTKIHFERYLRLLDIAVQNMSSGIPTRMKKLLLTELMRENPTPKEFVNAFNNKFGIRLEYDKIEETV